MLLPEGKWMAHGASGCGKASKINWPTQRITCWAVLRFASHYGQVSESVRWSISQGTWEQYVTYQTANYGWLYYYITDSDMRIDTRSLLLLYGNYILKTALTITWDVTGPFGVEVEGYKFTLEPWLMTRLGLWQSLGQWKLVCTTVSS